MESWSIYHIWNESIVAAHPTRNPDPRDYLYASELNTSLIDRYLKLKGTPYTNPPNPRSKRKFEAGDIWERIVEVVLKRAGIFIESQKAVKFKMPDCVPVSGRTDHIAGGTVDWEKALHTVQNEFEWLPDGIRAATKNIVENLSKTYPDGLKEIILEIKSSSSFMFDVFERTGKPSPNHKLQLYHYLKGLEYPEGHIVYICKDDCRMVEIAVTQPSSIEEEYYNDIKTFSDYYLSDTPPQPESLLVFQDDFERFSANWKVTYSPYLKLLYGFGEPMEYEDIYRPLAERFNRVFNRIRKGDKMTKLNEEVILEASRMGFDMHKLADDHKLPQDALEVPETA